MMMMMMMMIIIIIAPKTEVRAAYATTIQPDNTKGRVDLKRSGYTYMEE
jgi:hypothetical protein